MKEKKYPPSFKFAWTACTVVFYAVGFYMMYKNESSSGISRYGQEMYINGQGVVLLAVVFSFVWWLLFWPFRKKKKRAGRNQTTLWP